MRLSLISPDQQTCNPSDDSDFAGTELPNCQFLASSIQACQAKGKIITLSLGGATGAASFSSASQASAFGDTIWNLFLGGSSSTRPFGSAVLDGYVLLGRAVIWVQADIYLQRRHRHRGRWYHVLRLVHQPHPHSRAGLEQEVLRHWRTAMPVPRCLHVCVSVSGIFRFLIPLRLF